MENKTSNTRKQFRTFLIFISVLMSISTYSQSLRGYLVEAEKNSPALRKIQLEIEQVFEAIQEVGSLPDTEIGFGYFVQETETRVGAQRARASVSQSFPWFGVLKAKRESEILRSDAKANLFSYAKRELFFKIKMAYYRLHIHRKRHRVVLENLEVIKAYEQKALQALETGRATASDVLLIDLEKDNLENALERHVNLGESAKVSFNILMNREEDTEVKIPMELPVDLDLLRYNKTLIPNNPQLVQYDNLEKSVEKTREAVKKEGLPEINVGVDYILVDELPLADLADNGKDIIMPRVQLSIPLFSKKYKAKEKRLKIKQEELQATREEMENELRMQYEMAFSRLSNAVNSIRTYEESLEKVDRAEKLLLTTYETAAIDFKSIIDIQKLKLDYELKLINAQFDYFEQRSILEFITQD
ncbi:TolC family protein [Leptobacterium flavescens]|uniref:TolC family protein n=1 Tax=Leptobacterium flavescens TaxID=472055 RepID=A0A6P0US46_9FLAO|nr:TolC family protein [Leptobacterium flavescens]NER14808.1 TolC family protein [Leptobacterium flavescens]